MQLREGYLETRWSYALPLASCSIQSFLPLAEGVSFIHIQVGRGDSSMHDHRLRLGRMELLTHSSVLWTQAVSVYYACIRLEWDVKVANVSLLNGTVKMAAYPKLSG